MNQPGSTPIKLYGMILTGVASGEDADGDPAESSFKKKMEFESFDTMRAGGNFNPSSPPAERSSTSGALSCKMYPIRAKIFSLQDFYICLTS